MSRNLIRLESDVDINWAVLGARLARLSTTEQCPFFKAFAQEMLSYPTRFEMEMQLTCIRDGMGVGKGDNLNDKEKEVFATLGWSGK